MDGHDDTIFDDLDREWERMLGAGVLDRALARWGRSEPRLAEFPGTPWMFEFLEDPHGDPGDQSAVLLSLLTVARDDRLAALVVLQRMAPALKRIAAWQHPFTQNEWDCHIVAEAYEVIATYPIERRPSKVAANIVMDVRKRASAILSKHLSSQGELGLEPFVGETVTPDPAEEVEATSLIEWGRRRTGVPADVAELIVLTRVLGFTVKELAQRLGVPTARLRRRRWDAEQRMREVLPAT